MAEPWEVPANPLAGCTIAGDLVVNVDLYVPGVVGRSYGEALYGTDVYGDVDGDAGWTDISPRVQGVEIIRGGVDGAPIVPVEQCTITLLDPVDDMIFPMDPSREWPTVGAVCRVSLSDLTTTEPLPQFVGRIETVFDDHDDSGQRTVQVQAFGMIADLAVLATTWNEPGTTTSSLLTKVRDQAGWWWDPTIDFQGPDVSLAASQFDGFLFRQIGDVVSMSGRGTLDSTPDGRIRHREWPLKRSTPTIAWWVADCLDTSSTASPLVRYTADAAELLNAASVQTEAGSSAYVTDEPSIEKYGRRTNGVGFPLSGLITQTQGDVDSIAADALDAYSKVVSRVESVDLDSKVDARFLLNVVYFDTGQQMYVYRTGIAPQVEYLTRICGYTLRLVRGRASATVQLTTVTSTQYTPSDFWLTNGAENLLNGLDQLSNE